MIEPIIRVENLKKTFKVSKRANGLPGRIANLFFPKYEYKKAVDGISFNILQGEAVGFVGANGAGKSTTIKMLSGIIYPDEGNIEIAGFIPYKDRKKYVSNIGVVFGQKSQLSWDLPVVDSFELLRRIYSISDSVYKQNFEKFVDLLDMSSFINQPVRQLSLGQRMRADIAASLLHSPRIVFFDEPTIGLDVVAKEKIRSFIRYLNKEQGVTIIFTTHDMQDIEQTCERLILIDKAHKIYDGSINGLVDAYAYEKKLVVEFMQDYTIDEISDVLINDLEGHSKEFVFNPHKVSVKSVINNLSKYDIVDLTVENMNIERIVRQIYEGEIKL